MIVICRDMGIAKHLTVNGSCSKNGDREQWRCIHTCNGPGYYIGNMRPCKHHSHLRNLHGTTYVNDHWIPVTKKPGGTDVCYDYRIKTMFSSSLPPVVCRRAHCLIYVICVCFRIVVSNTYCVVLSFCFSWGQIVHQQRYRQSDSNKNVDFIYYALL
jgi:hypothetical protein